MSWHYLDGTAQKGPISDYDLAKLVADGSITESTPVWREGMADWQPYGEAVSIPPIPVAVAAPPSTPLGSSAPAVPAGGVPCAECGRIFPPSEVIRHGDVYICADCKPIFVQKVKEGIAPKGRLDYAGFGVRGGSIILDGIIIYVLILPIDFLTLRSMGPSAQIFNFFLNLVIGTSYYVFFLGKFGATLGKMANRLLVVNPDGSKISYGKAFGRYFASNWISGVFTLFIGYLMAIWDDEKRALHDRICNTRVIRKPRPAGN
jgi:uncharacterized RDD family membrane protein YckC